MIDPSVQNIARSHVVLPWQSWRFIPLTGLTAECPILSCVVQYIRWGFMAQWHTGRFPARRLSVQFSTLSQCPSVFEIRNSNVLPVDLAAPCIAAASHRCVNG